MAITSKSFRDFSLTFENNAVTNEVFALTNDSASKASVRYIVLYNFYEKPFDPFFGGNIIGLLFENASPDLENEITDNLEEVINLHEPRVAVIDIDTKWEENRNQLDVSINYVILGIPPIQDSVDIALKP